MNQIEEVAYGGSLFPPFTSRVTEMSPAPPWLKLKKVAATVTMALFFGALFAGIGLLVGWGWLLLLGCLLTTILLCLGLWLGLTAQLASCPYCDQTLGEKSLESLSSNEKETRLICPHCYEWLICNKGKVRAFTEEDAQKEKEFSAPVFEEGTWPKECILCGQPPTRYLKAPHESPGLDRLLLGKLTSIHDTIEDIPYCDDHEDLISLRVSEGKLYLIFPRLEMQRRYLALNHHKKRFHLRKRPTRS